MRKGLKKKKRKSREHKNAKEEAKEKEKLLAVRRWFPLRNQQRVGDCCHRIISFSQNHLKRKNVCFFKYHPELTYWPKFNEIGWNGQNRP